MSRNKDHSYKNKCWLYKLICWFSSSGPAGIGELFVGIAALITLWQADGILDELKYISTEAKYIREMLEKQKHIKSESAGQSIKAGTPIQKVLGQFKSEATALPGELYINSLDRINLERTINAKSLSNEEKQKAIFDALSYKR